ncbi:MAG: LysR family transcriptional regulator [Robiginitomaculum sp.]|nr:LysR family transcriptional regulator [Robiginitomaculum sp.]
MFFYESHSVPNTNIRQLRALVTVAKAENISAAAVILGRSQPAISQSIQGLERDFSVILFTRTKSGVFLTQAGQILTARAKTALGGIFKAVKEISNFDKKECSRIANAISTVHLKSLIATVEHGGFAQAARAENLAVPTVHRAARELEKIVGVVLFEKTSFGVQPTRAAVTLGAAGGRAFSEIRQARAEIAVLKGMEKGETVIGAMPLARAFLAPMAVMEFCARHRGHRISIVEAPYEILITDLARGRVDMLIGATRGGNCEMDVVEELVFEDVLSVLMRPEHPLASAPRLTSKRLAVFPWVAPRQSSPLRVHFDALFGQNLPPLDIVECNSLSAARVMLMNSDRLMLLSDAQAHMELDKGLITSRKPPGHTISRSISLTFRKNWRPTAAQKQLVKTVRRIASEGYGRVLIK